MRQSNGPGNIQIANVKLPKYVTRISGMKIRMRVRCFSLPEQISIKRETAVGKRFDMDSAAYDGRPHVDSIIHDERAVGAS